MKMLKKYRLPITIYVNFERWFFVTYHKYRKIISFECFIEALQLKQSKKNDSNLNANNS